MTEVNSLMKNSPLFLKKLQFLKKNMFHNNIMMIIGILANPGVNIIKGVVQLYTISRDMTKRTDLG